MPALANDAQTFVPVESVESSSLNGVYNLKSKIAFYNSGRSRFFTKTYFVKSKLQ